VIYPLCQPRNSATGGAKSIHAMCWLTIGILLSSALVLILASLWLLDSHRIYSRVFSDDHFHEVATHLPALKRAALARLVFSESDAVCTPEDPRGMLTSAGLAVLYLIGCEGRWFHHDLSVSMPSRAYTIHTVGNRFGCFLARLLGIGMERLQFHFSSRRIHHTVFTLNADEHRQFADRSVTPLSPEQLAAFRRHWALSRRMGSWQRIP
jgi:hypothetical protein